MTPSTAPLLRVDQVSRSFGGVHAVAGVSLSIDPGTVHGLIGPNGAGKTTILNLMSGILRPDGGSIWLRGERIDTLPAYRVAQLGVRRTYQSIRLFGAMSARDNVVVGLHNQRSDSLWRRLVFSTASRRAEQETSRRAGMLLHRVGIDLRAEVRARDLPYGEQRRLEIARALASAPAVLLLDEPTAGMSAAEATEVADLVRSVAREGTAVLLVEHNVELVMRVSDVLTVLNFGRVLASGPPEEIRRNPDVIAAYIGTQD